MCTTIAHGVFNAVLFAATALIIAALLTPAWIKLEDDINNATSSSTDINIPDEVPGSDEANEVAKHVEKIKDRGLIYYSCVESVQSFENCTENFWASRTDPEKATLLLLVLCIAFCVATMVWSIIAFCACCCKSCFTPLLIVGVSLAFVLDVIAIAVYVTDAGENGDILAKIKNATSACGTDLAAAACTTKLGYSIWLAVTGGIGLAAGIVCAVVLQCTASTSFV